jgi:uncharacterized protein
MLVIPNRMNILHGSPRPWVLAGASVYFNSGLLYIDLAAPTTAGPMLGSIAGGRILNKLSNETIQMMFLIIVILLTVEMLYKGVML